jgi:hypothetical protein
LFIRVGRKNGENRPAAMYVGRNSERKISLWSRLNEIRDPGIEVGKDCWHVAQDVVAVTPLSQ